MQLDTFDLIGLFFASISALGISFAIINILEEFGVLGESSEVKDDEEEQTTILEEVLGTYQYITKKECLEEFCASAFGYEIPEYCSADGRNCRKCWNRECKEVRGSGSERGC